jgi:anthranilate/para-aminobenzoate synthase component II
VGPAREIAHGKSLPVLHHGEGLFEGLPSPVSMMRYNSLVAQEPLPAQYRVTAWSEAGEIMALEHVTQPCWGVQFHPESVGSPEGLRLLANVVARVRQRSATGA